MELDEALTAALKALSQRHGTTLFMTLLAGWAAVLRRLSGQDDVVIGTPERQPRRATEIEGLIGFFVNTLALRVDLSGAPTRGGAAGAGEGAGAGGAAEPGHPLRAGGGAGAAGAQPGAHPALPGDVRLAERAGGQAGAAGAAGVAALGGRRQHVTAKFDLSLSLGEASGRIAGVVEYATALFERATVERWLGYLRAVLEAMVADERRSVERLALLPEAERRQVVEEWNATEAAYPREAASTSCSRRRWRGRPDAVAVVFEDERADYAELNARANRLAHHLRALGVGPDARVGSAWSARWRWWWRCWQCSRRAARTCRSDPAYPAERLRYMLEDSGAAWLLSRRRRCASSCSPAARRSSPCWTSTPTQRADAKLPTHIRRERTDAAAPGVRHLHLGLHRPAQGRGAVSTRADRQCWRGCGRATG